MRKKEKRLAVLASVGPYAAETLLLVVLPLLYVCLMSIMTRPSYGGSDIYKGWMKNKKSAMVSCNDGFRPVSFYIEALEEEASDWF